jgi:hypothetical protein
LKKGGEKNLLHPGGLSFEHSEALDRFKASCGQDGRELPCLPQEFLVGSVAKNRGDQGVEQQESNTGGDGKSPGVPEGEAKGQGLAVATKPL